MIKPKVCCCVRPKAKDYSDSLRQTTFYIYQSNSYYFLRGTKRDVVVTVSSSSAVHVMVTCLRKSPNDSDLNILVLTCTIHTKFSYNTCPGCLISVLLSANSITRYYFVNSLCTFKDMMRLPAYYLDEKMLSNWDIQISILTVETSYHRDCIACRASYPLILPRTAGKYTLCRFFDKVIESKWGQQQQSLQILLLPD